MTEPWTRVSELMFRTAIVWSEFKKVIQVEGHKQAVWAVKFVGEDRLLTGKLLWTEGFTEADYIQLQPTRPSHYISLTWQKVLHIPCRRIPVIQNRSEG